MLLCLFNLYAAYITRNVGLDEAQLESRLRGEISVTPDMDSLIDQLVKNPPAMQETLVQFPVWEDPLGKA